MELKSSLDSTDDDSLGKSFLTFFAKAISINKYENQLINGPIDINDEKVYRSIYIHLKYTKELYQKLSNLIQSKAFSHCTTSKVKLKVVVKGKIEEEEVDQISFHGGVPSDLWAACGSEVIKIAKQYRSFLSRKIQAANQLIEDTEALQRDLTSLIRLKEGLNLAQ